MKWSFRVTARFILQNLATRLYQSHDDCLWEIVRNGWLACMPEDKFAPGVGKVEITLVNNHPLAPKTKSLVIIDRGSGFTPPRIKLFCDIGPSREDYLRSQTGSHSGAAQHRQGRFAAFGLNSVCREEGMDASATGFYLLTRTGDRGPVTCVSMIPDDIEETQSVEARELNPNDNQLGELKGVRGSFSAIIVPNSVYSHYDEIRTALQSRIPRKPDQMFELLVGGKPLMPNSLERFRLHLAEDKGPIEAFLGRGVDDDPNGGIWFVDLDTGLPVVSGPQLGMKVPYPFWHKDLVGYIFVPGLLENQNVARDSLSPRFLRSQRWQKQVMSFLNLKASGPAKALLGKQEDFGTSKVSQIALDFASACNKLWGSPSLGAGVPFDTVIVTKNGSTNSGNGIGGNGGHGGSKRVGNPQERQRVLPVRIGEHEFALTKRPLPANVLAEVDSTNGKVIYFNEPGYSALPSDKAGRQEHVILSVLHSVGRWLYPDSPAAAMAYAIDRRQELLSK